MTARHKEISSAPKRMHQSYADKPDKSSHWGIKCHEIAENMALFLSR